MRIFRTLAKWCPALLATALVVTLAAQEGHPLKGSWIGEWAGNVTHGTDVILVMNWDGKTVSGIINPGTDNIALSKATLDPAGWKVHLEADAKDKAGAAVHYVIDGAIGQLEMANRNITGTWTNGKGKGKFEVHRQ